MIYRQITALLMAILGGLPLCNGAWDWLVYVGGLTWSFAAGFCSREKRNG